MQIKTILKNNYNYLLKIKPFDPVWVRIAVFSQNVHLKLCISNNVLTNTGKLCKDLKYFEIVCCLCN